MKIPLVDLKRQNKKYWKLFNRTVNNIITNADFICGTVLEKFEKQFAQFCNKKCCIGVNSGTDALFLSLKACGIGSGDEVIIPPNTFFATAEAVENTGAKVIFADVSTDTFTLDPNQILKHITSKTKAIIPVHLYGQPADIDPIIKIANKYHLIIIEDCCQAHGAKYKGKVVPVTETGAFSFYPGKNLGCFGDGGAVVTNNNKIANMIRMLRNHGSIKKYHHQLLGFNSRLDSLQAAILTVKIKYLTKWNQQRRKNAQLYYQYLSNVTGITLPKISTKAKHVFHIYAIQGNKRNLLQKYLKTQGINTVVHYPIPIHLQLPYRKKGFKNGDFPISEKQARKVLSLPMFPELTKKEIIYITKAIRNFYISD